ncbi:GNAT family N-acetyltransferase [uncultured Kordia sp.]|uniref:GNAT family N-acetyltransferase n=1 Tax=uncultured Kordia sp. TaxID=507699 RepID=UPI002636EA9E|nr:GNAT family N-acetyltransferase [uncultured Kordia sp.]
MEYHKDRFEDHSLVLFKKEKPIALFPANLREKILYSHQGLTFGGLILSKKSGAHEVNELLQTVINYAKVNNFLEIILKSIPGIYYEKNGDELNYFTSKQGDLIDRNLVLAIDYGKPVNIHKTKRKHYEKNYSLGFEIEETSSLSEFWNDVLMPKLDEKYSAKPVHSLAEIIKLQTHFPSNIIQYNLKLDGEILAGITIFTHKKVVKSQYGATTEKGESLRALEYLFMYLIEKFKEEEMHYFSMGTVDANNEHGYNVGLLKQKEELGCVCFTQDIYKIPIA